MEKIIRTATLSFSHAELIGLQRSGVQMGAPTAVPSNTVIDMFGMFGDGNNSNTFYPGLEKADYMPKPEDMVDVPFRIVSAAIVGAHSWKATDFSNEPMMKASVPMQANQPVFFDHEQSIPNWLGITINPYWQEATTNSEGKKIPAGINGTYRIDAKSNPKIARGLVLGAIGSTSTTVKFDWVPSHSFENPNDFYDKIGTIDARDNKMVCRVATKIYAYHENSLVWLGADPMAKKLDDAGQPIMPDFSSVAYSAANPLMFSAADPKEKQLYEDKKSFTINYAIADNVISLSRKENQPPTQTLPMKKFLVAFLASFGQQLGLTITLAADQAELTPEQETQLTTALSKLGLSADPTVAADQKKKLEFFAKLQLVGGAGALGVFDLATATGDFAIIPATEVTRVYAEAAKVTTLQPLADVGTEYLGFKKTEAIRLYKAAVGDNSDAAVVAMFEKANSKELDGLLKQYTKSATAKFGAHCSKCDSSDNITMRSSFGTGEETTTTEPAIRPKSIQEMAAAKASSAMTIGRK